MTPDDFLGTGAAGPSLDLGLLNDKHIKALEWGAMLEGRFGPSWAWSVKDFGDGHVEVVGIYNEEGHKSRARRHVVEKVELPETFEEFEAWLERDIVQPTERKKRATCREDMDERWIERNLRKTRKTVREKCLMMRADKLLTFTTRAAIVESEVFRKIVTKFLRDCRRSIDNFQYVAVFERHMSEKTSKQKYGSLHLHMAMAGFVSYKQLRHLWRVAVQSELKDGDYEGANIDASENKRKGLKAGHYERSRIARYMSKYLTKDMDDEFEPNKRRYWASRNIKKPEITRFFTAPALINRTFVDIFEGILDVDIKRVFMPERENGAVPPLIWLST